MKATFLLIVGFLGITSWVTTPSSHSEDLLTSSQIKTSENFKKTKKGFLVDPNRDPVIGKTYHVYSGEEHQYSGVTDVEGGFEIRVDKGDFRFIFELWGERFHGMDVTLPKELNALDSIHLKWDEVRDPQPTLAEKPMIYLYPEAETEVTVTLSTPMTFSYPEYNGGWSVTAMPNGNLHTEDRDYYGLFWEGPLNPPAEISEGAVVPGNATGMYLENALRQLGYTDWEANEFIVYWLPKMHMYEYNFIYFSVEEYQNQVPIEVNPIPDSQIRTLMYFKPLSAPMPIKRQDLSLLRVKRTGFTLVEWGGSQLPSQTKIKWNK